uniref:C2H2-type domain-containing protein n=1 Tax=Otus sunia TaxID=257818 RepID=A0A8C8B817_9STRI
MRSTPGKDPTSAPSVGRASWTARPSVCGRSFYWSSDLVRHHRTHTPCRP